MIVPAVHETLPERVASPIVHAVNVQVVAPDGHVHAVDAAGPGRAWLRAPALVAGTSAAATSPILEMASAIATLSLDSAAVTAAVSALACDFATAASSSTFAGVVSLVTEQARMVALETVNEMIVAKMSFIRAPRPGTVAV